MRTKTVFTFNSNKSTLLCFNVDDTDVIPQTYLSGEVIPIVDSDNYLGNYISTNITDRNIFGNICDLYQRSNRVINDFRVCDMTVFTLQEDSDNYLGNYISTNITDRNIFGNICDLYQRSNRVINDFRYDSIYIQLKQVNTIVFQCG